MIRRFIRRGENIIIIITMPSTKNLRKTHFQNIMFFVALLRGRFVYSCTVVAG